jgi:hypothetical protein
LSEEQSNSYDEIVGAGNVKKKLRSDAAIFIQYWLRHSLIQRMPRNFDVSHRLTVRFKFVTAKNTFIFKKKSLTNDIPTLDEVFDQVESNFFPFSPLTLNIELSTNYYDKYHRKCVRIKMGIIPRIEDCSDYQYELDVCFLKLFDLVHKCYSFLAEIEEATFGKHTPQVYDSIEDIRDYFDMKKKRGHAVRTFMNYKLQLIDARIPITSLHEGIMEIDQRLKNPEKRKRGGKSGSTARSLRTMRTMKTMKTVNNTGENGEKSMKTMKSIKDAGENGEKSP